MELYITTDLEDWGLGIHFYKNINIHSDYKFAIDLSILFITIQVDFWRIKKCEIVIDEEFTIKFKSDEVFFSNGGRMKIDNTKQYPSS